MLAATKALGLGYGGVSKVARASGLSRVTITHGIRELSKAAMAHERVRRKGAGHPAVELKNPRIIQVLDDLVEPVSPARTISKDDHLLWN